jgi:HSP20 family molecular chaperone IbpA
MLNIRTIGELQRQINQLERQLQRASYRAVPSAYPNRFWPTAQERCAQPLHSYEQQSQWAWHQLSQAAPHTDILELDDQYLLEIALPGVVMDDVELKVECNVITVVAKRTPSMFEEKAGVIRKELPAGYLYRQFEFDAEILPEQVEARMDRGILFVSIPKVESAYRVPVSVGAFETHHPGVKTRVPSKTEAMRSGKEVAIK